MTVETLPPPVHLLIVGNTPLVRQAADELRPTGVTTLVAASDEEALTHLTDSAPDLVLVGGGAGGEVFRRLRDRPGRRLPVVVIGGPETADGPGPMADYLPADVGVGELVAHIRATLNQVPPTPAVPSRAALPQSRLAEETDRELRRAHLSGRPGMLAAVSVAELDQLRRRLGGKAEQALAAAFDQLFALDAHVLEQHSVRAQGGFFLLMPEIEPAAAAERLRRLSRRVAAAVLDINGEQVLVTPVVGYAAFAGAADADELRDRTALALDDAARHLDLVPVPYSSALAPVPAAPVATRDLVLALVERLRSPLQIVFTLALLVLLPFLFYVVAWYAGVDLTLVTYPLVAITLAVTAGMLYLESLRAVGAVEPPPEPVSYPTATAIIAAYLPNEAATIVDTVTTVLGQDYPGELQVILAYNTPQPLPVEQTLAELAAHDSRLLLLKVQVSTSKAQNVNAALAHVRGEFVGVFDADHHPEQGSFARAWRWLAQGHDIVQGHCVVRNGEASWLARMVAVEFETIYAVSHPGRARLHGFGIFGGSNGYWRSESLRQIRMQGTMLTEDIDSSMRSLLDGFSIVSDPGLVSTELAPTTMRALWNQRMRWAQGWTQTARRHLRPALRSKRLSRRQKIGATFLLGWTQAVPWITIQVIPVLGFTVWRDGGFGRIAVLVPLFVLLTLFTFSVGPAQAIFAYVLGDSRIRQHRGWFVMYAIHSMLWYGELKNLIVRVAQLKELSGERQWRVTPRTAEVPAAGTPPISASRRAG